MTDLQLLVDQILRPFTNTKPMTNRLSFYLNSTKIYALYFRGAFVIALPTREDCVAYGEQRYDGWDCSIEEKYMSDDWPYPDPAPITTPYPHSIPPYKWPGPVTCDSGPFAPGTK